MAALYKLNFVKLATIGSTKKLEIRFPYTIADANILQIRFGASIVVDLSFLNIGDNRIANVFAEE